MLRIIDGQIGAGKTYYAVDHVLRKYSAWSSELDEWVQRESEVPVLVVTNISDCRLGESLDAWIEKSCGLKEFFHVDHQREFCKGLCPWACAWLERWTGLGERRPCSSLGRVRGTSGDEFVVAFELDDGRLVRLRGGAAVSRCRCAAMHLGVGASVPLWRADGVVPVADLPYALVSPRSDEERGAERRFRRSPGESLVGTIPMVPRSGF